MNGADLDDLTLDQLKDMIALLCNKIDELHTEVEDMKKPEEYTISVPTVTSTTSLVPGSLVSTTRPMDIVWVDDLLKEVKAAHNPWTASTTTKGDADG